MVIAYSEFNNVPYHIPIINCRIPHLTTLIIERCRSNNDTNKPSGNPDLTTVEIIYNRWMKPTSRHRGKPIALYINTESNLWYYMVHQLIITNAVSLLTYTFPTILYYNHFTKSQNPFLKSINFQNGLKPQSMHPNV